MDVRIIGRQPAASSLSKFDFTLHMRLLCEDMVLRLAELRHIDMQRVMVGFASARRRGTTGVYATLSPLRFHGGQLYTYHRRRRWGRVRLCDAEGREILYILTFYLPRFLELSLPEKLLTVVHELWHISPRFDGDIRRLAGRCYAHGASKKKYDAKVQNLLDKWLALNPPESLYDFLWLNFRELVQRHGAICGVRSPRPKLIPLD